LYRLFLILQHEQESRILEAAKQRSIDVERLENKLRDIDW
jgi:hypothetical protein